MPTILIAEDDRPFRRCLTEWFAETGYTVHATENGATAWQLLQTVPVDVLLVDHRLPGMLGSHLCQWMTHTPALAEVPIIMLTAHMGPELGTLCPAAMLVRKPIALPDLLDLVDTLCPPERRITRLPAVHERAVGR